MSSSLGAEYPLEIEMVSKPKAEYQSDEWMELDLPTAPAVMLDDDVLVEGADIPEDKLIAAIREKLGMPTLEPKKRSILKRLFD